MIARVRGVLLHRAPGEAVVDVQGVGYRLLIPLTTFYALPEEGAEVLLHAVTVVREDAFLLFGFLTPAEKDLFEMLIGVSKIGPRTGLNILSGMPAAELREAIGRQDVARLSRIPGIGLKTAERLVLELRDKLPAAEAAGEAARPGGIDADEARTLDDVLLALVNLGYRKKDAERALREVWEGGERSPEQLIRTSLARLTR